MKRNGFEIAFVVILFSKNARMLSLQEFLIEFAERYNLYPINQI